MLMYAQDEVGAVTKELIEEVARRCKVTPLQVDEVVGYYSMLHRKPMGKFHVQVCTNISCLLVGGEELYEHAREARHRTQGNIGDGQFSLEEVECMGACSWAPAVEINYDFPPFRDAREAGPADRWAEESAVMAKQLYNQPSPLETRVVSKNFTIEGSENARRVPGKRRL